MNYALNKLLYGLANDAAISRSFEADPVTTAASYGVETDQLDAILRVDVSKLAEVGVHPLLLMGYALASGMSVADYQKQLSRSPDR